MTATNETATTDSVTPTRRWTWAFLVLVAAPATLGLTLFALLAFGEIGMFAPGLLIGAVYVYRAVVASTHSRQTRAAAREVGALVLAPMFGWGAFVGLMVLGVATEILPFISPVDPHPYEDAWMIGSVVVSIAVACATWWLLRKWADQSRPSTRAGQSARDS